MCTAVIWGIYGLFGVKFASPSGKHGPDSKKIDILIVQGSEVIAVSE